MADQDMDCCVRVAVRIRPQIPREIIDMCRICTQVTPNEPQIILGADKAFTYDYVFDVNSPQAEIYNSCVERLVEGAMKGYNGTVLAYGQTGSGKTFTMGTGFECETNEDQEGIIPRAVRHLFSTINRLKENPYDENGVCMDLLQFSVGAQFMELYNEEIIDLLDPYNKTKLYKITADPNGAISVPDATIKPINGPQDAMRCLQQGALARTTASTQMNAQSSRSHAIFTILIKRQRRIAGDKDTMMDDDLETLTAKFHFVDLAGSERLKRTGNTGDRLREGISINSGLLSLGNVISALGDSTKKVTHVPYRDSKLTRLLQDSLGGNSQTLMIACVSPSDRDFMETLNTLKYANRARNITNKVVINQDQSSRTISLLRREIAALQLELIEYKQGKRAIDAEGNSTLTDTFHENSMLLADNKRLQQRIKAMQETINNVTEKNVGLLSEKETNDWQTNSSDKSVTELVSRYIKEIEKLRAKLIESEQMYQQLKKVVSATRKNIITFADSDDVEEVIDMAKRKLEKERELFMSKSLPGFNSDNQSNNENENENDSSDDSESDESEEKVCQEDLIDISEDIELKSKLIEQLEMTKNRMEKMRQIYEEKLNVLNSKIINTQRERDQVLANMSNSVIGTNPSAQNDKAKKIRDEYERKISDMQKELKKLQLAQREHARQHREIQAQECQLRTLKAELGELKSAKIKLVKRMNDQISRHKEAENRKAREIAQLRKEQRKQSNAIKSLQNQSAVKDQVLKRRIEEVAALKRDRRSNLSTKAAGRLPPKKSVIFNQKQARTRWETLQRTINRAARTKQTMIELEGELERLIAEREALIKDLNVIKRRQKTEDSPELASEEDTIRSSLRFVQENITQVQASIVEIEDGKQSTSDTMNIQNLLDNVRTFEEAKFLLEKLTSTSILQTCETALTQNRLVDNEALLSDIKQESNMQHQLLQHVLLQNPSVNFPDTLVTAPTMSNKFSGTYTNLSSLDLDNDPKQSTSSESHYVSLNSMNASRSPSPLPDHDTSFPPRTPKVRRRTAQPQDLLFGETAPSTNDQMTRSFQHQLSQPKLQQQQQQQQNDITRNSLIPLSRVPSAPGSLKGLMPYSTTTTPTMTRHTFNSNHSNNPMISSPLFSRKTLDASAIPISPRFSRRPFPNKASPGLDDDQLPPQSPQVYRRATSREDAAAADVFSRLGAGTTDPVPGGSIREYSGKIKLNNPLNCTHIVEGHSNSVLAVKVFDHNLYTAAADRTVRVWDLNKMNGPVALLSHAGPVLAIEHDLKSKLLFSACGAYVRVWDLRASHTKAIKTLCSSGTTLSGNANLGLTQVGESPVTAVSLGQASNNLYIAASDKVRIWDLRNVSCIGKLIGGHQAAVMCVTTWKGSNNTDFVATGSKDHYVKVFEVASAGSITPLLHLEPPHYDGVQALAVTNGSIGADAELFSGSRDTGIKRWDLQNGELKQSMNNAHKGWVSGMTISDDILLSACRGGIIRLWNVNTCDSIADMKTDSSINDIVSNGQMIYTAANDGKIRLWKFSQALRRQMMLQSR